MQVRRPLGTVLLCTLSVLLSAQKTPSNNSPNNSGPSSSTLPGLSYDHDSWTSLLVPNIPETKRVVACYQIRYAHNSNQPFVLIPVHPTSHQQAGPLEPFVQACSGVAVNDRDPAMKKWCSKYPAGSWSPCSFLDDTHPILMGQKLVVGINTDAISTSRLKILNLNVTLAQSSPILPPVRPSASTTSQSVALGGDHYITWPNEMPGDQIPTISVNTIYTPPVPGERWIPRTYYPVGSVVTSRNRNGHYYVAIAGDVSGYDEPDFPIDLTVVVTDNQIVWVDSGPASNAAGTKLPTVWLPNHQYSAGDNIVDPYNGHVYVAMFTGQSGALPDNPLALPSPTLAVPQVAPIPAAIQDGSVLWKKSDQLNCPNQWIRENQYYGGDLIGHYNGVCYEASADGDSGPNPVQPFFPFGRNQPFLDNNVEWVNIGVIPPQVITGALATDQTVNLLNLQLPQVHTKSYYNVASGVVYSTVHSRTFAIAPGATDTSGQTQISSSPTIDPVLFFTAYPWPADTEQHCSFPRCFWQTKPGVSFGFSLVSPSNSFYAGGTFEAFRNIQIVIGNNWAKESRLPATPIKLANNATSPVTAQKFSNGAFYGLTLNVSGFIQSLFGGGGGGGSSKSSSSSQ